MNVNQKFLIGLASYSNQVQLSIDRSDWATFRMYVKSIRPFAQILSSLRKNFKIDPEQNFEKKLPQLESTLATKLISIFFRKGTITTHEAEYIYCSFLELFRLVEEKADVSDFEKSAIRMQMVNVCRLIDRRVSSKKNLSYRVEHYNSAKTRSTISINRIVGSDWPD